jgi:hypothetical protein
MDDKSFWREVNHLARQLGGSAAKIARTLLSSNVERTGWFADNGKAFLEHRIGRWAYSGCYDDAREALRKGAEAGPDPRQPDLFRDLPERAFVPSSSGFVRLSELALAQWREAVAFKQRKAAETLAEAERMEAFERDHLELWEAHPDWRAEKVAAKRMAAQRGRRKKSA